MRKQLYVTITDNVDRDTWVLGAVDDSGIGSAMEWITTELECLSYEEAVDRKYTVGFQLLTEEEVNSLPQP